MNVLVTGSRGRVALGALRPPGVWTEAHSPRIEAARAERPEYETDPCRGLIEIEQARRLLGWSPEHSWRSFQRARIRR